MLDFVYVKCNGVPFTMQHALDYGLKIDEMPDIEAALSEVPTEDEMAELESKVDDLESQFDNEQERADIAVDRYIVAEEKLEEIPNLEAEIEELKAENEDLQGSNLSRQCKAKDKWIEKLLSEKIVLEDRIEKLEMINEL